MTPVGARLPVWGSFSSLTAPSLGLWGFPHLRALAGAQGPLSLLLKVFLTNFKLMIAMDNIHTRCLLAWEAFSGSHKYYWMIISILTTMISAGHWKFPKAVYVLGKNMGFGARFVVKPGCAVSCVPSANDSTSSFCTSGGDNTTHCAGWLQGSDGTRGSYLSVPETHLTVWGSPWKLSSQ